MLLHFGGLLLISRKGFKTALFSKDALIKNAVLFFNVDFADTNSAVPAGVFGIGLYMKGGHQLSLFTFEEGIVTCAEELSVGA